MKAERHSHTIAGKWKMLWLSIALGILFWIVDSFIDVYVFHQGDVITQIFRPDYHNAWMRSFIMTFLILLGAVAQYMVIKSKQAEEALRESEEKYRSVVENVGIGISIISPDMKIMALNGQMKKWFPDIDVTKKPICYRAFNYPPRENICTYCPTCKTLADGQRHESITSTPSGDETRNYRVISSPVKNAEGGIISAIEMVEDITERVRAEEDIEKSSALLEAINRIQTQFIADTEPDLIFNSILSNLLSLTNSSYGFIGEIIYSAEETPHLKTHAITNIAWNAETRSLYEKYAPNMEFYNLKTLFGEVMTTGKPVISNDPSADPRRGGLPEGHPPLNSFLGLPLYFGNNMIGMAGIANRPGGYKEETIEYLQPLLNTYGHIIEAYRNSQRRQQAEGTLRKSEDNLKLYQALINQSNDSVEVLDPETGHFLNVNNKTCADLGYSREELLSMNVFNIDPVVKPSDFPKIMEELKRTGGSIWTGVHMRKDGSTFPVEVSLKLVQLDRSYLVAVARDVTNRNKAEKALKESEERYRNLFENAHDMIQSIAPDGHFIFVNPAWLKTMGYEWEELQSLTIYDIMHPDHKARCSETFQRVMSGESLDNIEGAFVTKDGRPVNVAGNASVRSVNGRVIACDGIFRNVTEHKRMEEQIFQITHDWEETFNTITDMITIHDKDFNIIHANKAAEKILGLPILNVSPSKCYLYYHGTGGPPEGCPSCECLKTGMSSVNEIYEPHLKMFIEIRAIPRFDSNNNLAGLIHVVRDITERRKLEDQLRQSQKMEAVGQLAGGIAHDFNNILTAVIGYSTILKMRMGNDDPLKVNLDHILSASEKGANLTQSLLAFSRQQISNPEPLNVNKLIRSMEMLLLRVIGENIELKTELAEDMTIMADHVQIDQVLINLCTNARDAMPDGGVLTIGTGLMELDREFIKAHGYGTSGTYAVISVSDTGIGIDDKIRERIFEPFYTTKEVGKGTGLGLSIVYGIIKQHNGYITCDSTPGEGSTFRIYLPISKSAVTETLPEEMPESENQTATILLAEDELSVRKLTKQILENFGYTVIEAADGEETVKRFIENKDRIDMIILDIIMPKMNGKEVYERIKKINPGIKALMTSGYPADFIQIQDIISQGVAFMAKPVSPAGLVKKVKEELAK